ncbi:hypothetical protein C8Q76DRAFT_636383 [Earliella scabrosa]|nr:hypothetical protein C8Q76DRAFT_636383 [Earliella scabrosa]
MDVNGAENPSTVLPSLEDLPATNAPAILRDAVERMQNPDVKIKKESQLSDDFLLSALTWEGINRRYPIPVPREISEYRFKRKYISHLYGGNPQAEFPKPADEKVGWHGINDWQFITTDFNPHAPTRPGYSGLYFSQEKAADDWDESMRVHRLFVQFPSNTWVYMGQYKMSPGRTLGTAEWKAQPETVRRTWAKAIRSKEWGDKVAVRIALRKARGANYEPTEADVKNAEVDELRRSLSDEDIIRAFDEGEEEFGTYTMTCVGYDADFVRFLARNADRYIVPPSKASRKSTGLSATGPKRFPGDGGGKGNKRSEAVDGSDTENSEPGSDGDVKHILSGPTAPPQRRSGRARVKRVRTS